MSGLQWPTGFERTPASERERNRQFTASIASTTKDLEREMRRLDPSEWRASIGNEHTKSNGLPLHNANPDDPGFVLRWTKEGEEFAVACDAYTRLRDNLRTVYLWVHETRMRSQRPVETGESEFAAARLPHPDDVDAVAGAPPPHAELGVPREAEDAEIRSAYQERVKEAHPDNGGSQQEFKRVRRAKERLLGDSA
jgi:DnaJ-domain-containing protein 1